LRGSGPTWVETLISLADRARKAAAMYEQKFEDQVQLAKGGADKEVKSPGRQTTQWIYRRRGAGERRTTPGIGAGHASRSTGSGKPRFEILQFNTEDRNATGDRALRCRGTRSSTNNPRSPRASFIKPSCPGSILALLICSTTRAPSRSYVRWSAVCTFYVQLPTFPTGPAMHRSRTRSCTISYFHAHYTRKISAK